MLTTGGRPVLAAEPPAGGRRRAFGLVMMLAALLAVATVGCAGAGVSAGDASWAAMMVPHHLAGVALDDLALRRTDDVRVRELAFEMNGYQGRELDDLRRLAAGAPPGDHAAMAMGMPTDAELAALGALAGPAFDRRFLTLMIRHHEGALAMTDPLAGPAPPAGTGRAVRTLAAAVVRVQTDQVARMRTLLADLG